MNQPDPAELTRQAETKLVLHAIELSARTVHGRYLPDVLALESQGLLSVAEKESLKLPDGRRIFN